MSRETNLPQPLGFVADRLAGGGWAELAKIARIQPVNVDQINYYKRNADNERVHDFLIDRLIILDASDLPLEDWRDANAEALSWAQHVTYARANLGYDPLKSSAIPSLEADVFDAESIVLGSLRGIQDGG